MDNSKCQRCWTQKAIFRCRDCKKHQILCSQCDTYVHSMNNNKFHERFGLNSTYKNICLTNSLNNKQKLYSSFSEKKFNKNKGNIKTNSNNEKKMKSNKSFNFTSKTSNKNEQNKANFYNKYFKSQTNYNTNDSNKSNLRTCNNNSLLYQESLKENERKKNNYAIYKYYPINKHNLNNIKNYERNYSNSNKTNLSENNKLTKNRDYESFRAKDDDIPPLYF